MGLGVASLGCLVMDSSAGAIRLAFPSHEKASASMKVAAVAVALTAWTEFHARLELRQLATTQARRAPCVRGTHPGQHMLISGGQFMLK